MSAIDKTMNTMKKDVLVVSGSGKKSVYTSMKTAQIVAAVGRGLSSLECYVSQFRNTEAEEKWPQTIEEMRAIYAYKPQRRLFNRDERYLWQELPWAFGAPEETIQGTKQTKKL